METLERSVPFYVGILGLREVARRDFGDGPIAFLSTGRTHHDLALHEVGVAAMPATGRHLGLHHLALRIGDDLETLRAAQDHLTSHGIPIQWALDHRVSQGLYLIDPDGHLLELYVDDDPELWRAEPSLVATSTRFGCSARSCSGARTATRSRRHLHRHRSWARYRHSGR